MYKHNFVDRTTDVYTQANESFNNKIKLFIKEKRGVMKEIHEIFCSEFLLYEWFGRENIDELSNYLKFDFDHSFICFYFIFYS